MFKSLLVLLGTGLLAIAASNMESRRSFRSGHEYTFEYDGQVASSMSQGEQYAASRFRALVKLNFVTDTLVTIELERPQMGQWNDYLESPEEFQKFDKFEFVEIKDEHMKKLKLPFQMRYTNGKVSDIVFDSEDMTFSENIKRAILNTLQVQLENPTETEERDADFYSFRFNETTIEGDCESLYTIAKVPSRTEKVDSYNVSKIVDFTQCQYRPELRYNYFRYAEPMELGRENIGEKMVQKLVNSNPALEISSVYEFALNGDRRQFIIQQSKVSSRYIYQIMDAERVNMITFAIARMTFKDVERKESTNSMTSTKQPATLVYSEAFDVLRERFIAEGDETILRKTPYMKMTNGVVVVSNIVNRLVENSVKETVEGMDEHATRYLTQLVDTLRHCSRSDIQEIHEKIFNADRSTELEKTFVQGVLSDAMAIAGTKNTIDHLFNKIQSGELSTTRAASILSKLMNLRLVSYETVKNLHKLCQHSRIEESTMLKRTCMLTYGAMVNAMCKVDHPFQHGDKYTTSIMGRYCEAGTKKDIAKEIINYFNKASTRAEKVLALKTMGNMGIENTVNFLEQLIRDWNVEKIIRIQAIDALRQMRQEIPRKIQRILLPVFQNRREHPEIRMNAVYQLLHTRPDKAILDMIMVEMIREPNTHVKSFVHQLIYHLAADSEKIFDQKTAQNYRSMLNFFDVHSTEDKTAFATSKFFSSVIGVDHRQFHKLASQINLAVLFSNDSRLPKEVMATLNLLANNRMVPNTYQVGMHSQNLEFFLERLYQALGSKSIDDILIREPRSITEDYNPVNFLKNIYNRLKVATRRVSSDVAPPMVLFYTRWHDMDTFFCLTEEDSLPQLLQNFIVDGRIDVSPWDRKNYKFTWASASYGYEQQVKTPMISGLPLIVTVRIPTISFIDGSVSFTFSDKNDNNRVSNARSHLKVEPKMATTVVTKMEVFSPLFTSGILTLHSAQMRLPVDLVTKVQLGRWFPQFELKMPKEEVRVIHLQTRPVTFYRVWPTQSGVYVEPKEKTLIIEGPNNALHQKQVDFTDPFLGMKIKMDAHWHADPLMSRQKLMGDWLLCGENAFEFKILPTAQSSKALKVGLEYVRKEAKDARSVEIPNVETLFGQYTAQMFADAEQDELRLIKEQMKLAAGKLDRYNHLSLKVEAVHGARPHLATFDSKVLCDNRMILCIAHNNLDLDSTWTFKSTAQLAMPELRGVVAGIPSQHMIATIAAGFGSAEKNQIVYHLYGRPSVQKIETVKRMLNLRDEKKMENIFENAPEILKSNDYIMVFENKLSPKWNNRMHHFYNYLSFAPFVSMPNRDRIQEETTKRIYTLMTRLTLDEDNYNMTISMPDKDLQMDWNNVVRSSGSKAKSIYDVLRRTNNDDAECVVKNGKYIKSFDGKSFKLPMTSCYTILAKDCTEEPKFVLMAKKLEQYGNELKLKMVTREKTYEMYKNNGKMVVKVDAYIISESDFEQHGIFRVGNEKGIYEIRCSKTGASARFDGVNIIARISAEYMNQQCGVCGHYNGDISDELRMPNNEEASSLRQFHESYLYRDGECDPSVVQAMTKDSSEEKTEEEYSQDFEDYDNDENIDPIRKTITWEHHNEICFSLSPVKTCPHGSYKKGTKSESINFTCMNRNDRETHKLLRQLRDQHTIELPTDAKTTTTRSMDVPNKCVSSFSTSEREDNTFFPRPNAGKLL